jgi:hypothetical protein
MQDPTGRQNTPSNGAAEAIAAGGTGRWLRPVSQCDLISRAARYVLIGYLTLRLALDAQYGGPSSIRFRSGPWPSQKSRAARV